MTVITRKWTLLVRPDLRDKAMSTWTGEHPDMAQGIERCEAVVVVPEQQLQGAVALLHRAHAAIDADLTGKTAEPTRDVAASIRAWFTTYHSATPDAPFSVSDPDPASKGTELSRYEALANAREAVEWLEDHAPREASSERARQTHRALRALIAAIAAPGAGDVEDSAALTRGLANAARALEECGQVRSAASARTIIAAHGGQ